jgi:hypothetical protein
VQKIQLQLGLSAKQKELNDKIKAIKPPYIVFPAGRRFGKTEFAVRWQCPKVLSIPTDEDSPHGWCSPTFRQAKLGFFKYRKFLRKNSIPFKAILTELYIDIFGSPNHRVQFFSTDRPELMEGFSFKSMVIEEAGIQLKKREIWENSIQPTLIDHNAPTLFTGTPKGKGIYHEMYLKGLDGQDKDYLSLHATSYDNCKDVGGFLERTVLDRIVRNLPERAIQQEIMAEFIDSGGMVFRNTKECIKGSAIQPDKAGVLLVKQRDLKKKYIAGLDLAKVNDWTVLTIGSVEGEVYYIERFNQLDWSVQKQRIIKACKEWHCKLVMDSTGVGDPIYEDVRKNGIGVEPYQFTSTSKKQLIDRLIVSIENKKIILPNWDALIHEFDAYEYEITSAGNVRTNAPSGFHDDIVISVALWNWQVNNGVSSGEIISRISLGADTQSSRMDW